MCLIGTLTISKQFHDTTGVIISELLVDAIYIVRDALYIVCMVKLLPAT